MGKLLMLFAAMLLLSALGFWFVQSIRARRRAEAWREWNEMLAKNENSEN